MRPFFASIAIAAAMASFVAGDAAAQVVCGDTVTTSVQLTADLTCPGTRGLVIGADKVTIDLNGFTLSGDNGVGDVGIDNGLGFDAVTIKNGRIQQFDEGISIGGNAQKNVITNLTVFACVNDGIDLNDSDLTKISKVIVSANGAGIHVHTDGTGNVIEKSTILGNTTAGVDLVGNANLVQKNQFTNNGVGVHVVGSSNRVIGNSVYRSDHVGIDVGGGSGNSLTKNTTTGNVDDGIQVQDATATVVSKNVVAGNRENGILVTGNADGTLVTKNVVTGGSLDGISVELDADGVRVEGNTAIGQRLNGILVANPTATVAKNTANANLSYGVRSNANAVDGGGNKAAGNGDGDCLGFVCK